MRITLNGVAEYLVASDGSITPQNGPWENRVYSPPGWFGTHWRDSTGAKLDPVVPRELAAADPDVAHILAPHLGGKQPEAEGDDDSWDPTEWLPNNPFTAALDELDKTRNAVLIGGAIVAVVAVAAIAGGVPQAGIASVSSITSSGFRELGKLIPSVRLG